MTLYDRGDFGIGQLTARDGNHIKQPVVRSEAEAPQFGQIAGILKGSQKRVGSDRAGALLSQDNFLTSISILAAI